MRREPLAPALSPLGRGEGDKADFANIRPSLSVAPGGSFQHEVLFRRASADASKLWRDRRPAEPEMEWFFCEVTQGAARALLEL